jgi:hypothetical protein
VSRKRICFASVANTAFAGLHSTFDVFFFFSSFFMFAPHRCGSSLAESSLALFLTLLCKNDAQTQGSVNLAYRLVVKTDSLVSSFFFFLRMSSVLMPAGSVQNRLCPRKQPKF